MSAPSLASDRPAPSPVRFWQDFVTPAVFIPLVWTLLQGLAGVDFVITFYFVSLVAVPIVLRLVFVTGWRLARQAWNGPRAWLMVPAIALLALPSAAILAWGIYCAVWLAILLVTFDF